jgi:uncharacterized protein (DUF302 family)
MLRTEPQRMLAAPCRLLVHQEGWVVSLSSSRSAFLLRAKPRRQYSDTASFTRAGSIWIDQKKCINKKTLYILR